MTTDNIKLAVECGASSGVRTHLNTNSDSIVFVPKDLNELITRVRSEECEKLLNRAIEVKNIIAKKYQDRIDSGTSDMTSNSDWMRLEGAVSVVESLKTTEWSKTKSEEQAKIAKLEQELCDMTFAYRACSHLLDKINK
jgi:hypothetical protein